MLVDELARASDRWHDVVREGGYLDRFIQRIGASQGVAKVSAVFSLGPFFGSSEGFADERERMDVNVQSSSGEHTSQSHR